MKRHQTWLTTAKWAGHSLSATQLGLLDQFSDWLATEGTASGGIGPAEADRIDSRHIADSLLFAVGLEGSESSSILDVGSGVGLPGIPLAILHPQTEVVLLDRSGRRTDLARRIVRILDLKNVQVVQGEIGDIAETYPVVVSRATFDPPRAAMEFSRVLSPHGVAIVGGSWQARPEQSGWETVEVPAEILDQAVWILMMRNA